MSFAKCAIEGSVCTRLILAVQIVSYLHSLDVPRLARASLKVHAILMSRNSAHVWITVKRVIGMPECPPDLSEPQYASFVFEHTCFVSDRAPRLVDLSPIGFRHVVLAER